MNLFATLALLSTSILLANNPSHATSLDNALGIYLEKLADNSTSGVVEQDDLIFFIAEQPCLSKKKHSGTKESRRARKTIAEIVSLEFINRSNGISRKLITYPGVIGDAVYNKALANLAAGSAHLLSKTRLVLDKEISPCLHRVVTAMPLANFTIKQPPSPIDIDQENLLLEVLSDALSENNSIWLSAFFTAFASTELALVYQLQNFDVDQVDWPIYDTVINTSQQVTKSKSDLISCDFNTPVASSNLAKLTDIAKRGWCSAEVTTPLFNWQKVSKVSQSTDALKTKLLQTDYTGAVNIVFNAHGAVLFATVPQVYRTMAKSHFSQAQLLFKSGKNADEIIRLLTIAVNLDPKNHKSWILLGTMMRAKNAHTLAMNIYFQALLQQPQNTDVWINMAKSLFALGELNEANKLATLTQQFSKPFAASDWATKEAAQLIKNTVFKSE